jgi:L-asparagine oxygenase
MISPVSLEEISKFVENARKIIISSYVFPETFCSQTREFSCYIPDTIKTQLSSSNFNDYLLFRDFPTEWNRKTPENHQKYIGETTVLCKIQAILLSYIGDILAYESIGEGCVLQDIVPEKEKTNIDTTEIRTEQAFSIYRPDIVSLACLRSDPTVSNYILSAKTLLAHLTPEEIELLYAPLWNIGVDESFRMKDQEFVEGNIRGPMSILYGEDRENPFLRFDQYLMFGITKEAHEMIPKIVEIYYKYRTAICLQQGDILILDNRKVIHGQSPLSPKYDGTDRFLVRCFATLDYSKSESVRKGRMVLAKHC